MLLYSLVQSSDLLCHINFFAFDIKSESSHFLEKKLSYINLSLLCCSDHFSNWFIVSLNLSNINLKSWDLFNADIISGNLSSHLSTSENLCDIFNNHSINSLLLQDILYKNLVEFSWYLSGNALFTSFCICGILYRSIFGL